MEEKKNAGLKLLSFDDVLAKDDVEYKVIDVPEWGGAICIASLSAADIAEWSMVDDEGLPPAAKKELRKRIGARLIVRSLVDKPGGVRIGKDEHVEKLRSKRNSVLERILKQVMELNGLRVKADEAKNGSGGTTEGDSPSD